MKIHGHIITQLALLCLLCTSAQAQRFLPDDPIPKDPDDLNIEKPARIELSLSYDMIQNSFGLDEAGELLRAQNINTLDEVPDSSWFTNRIGIKDLTLEELAQGMNQTGGPDISKPLTIVRAGLFSFTEGLTVQDIRGDVYYLIFDRAGMPNMATGAAVVANKFFYAAGYNVLPASIAIVDMENIAISPDALIMLLGEKEAPLDREFLNLFLEDKERREDGKYRVAAYQIPPGDGIGEFKFYGTRSDDPNDIVSHENRRELRGMKVFSSWLNHYQARSINTLDRYETHNGRSYVKHYLIDFSTALGSGNDLDGNLVPKDKQSGNEYTVWGDTGATLKTALSLGFWKRPWMKVDYPYPKYAELGRFEGDFFQPDQWVPQYPNAAFIRMLPDDAFWATKILARFSDDAIRAIVQTGEYDDPAAENYLVETLIKRRDKIVSYYFAKVNPLDGFSVKGEYLEFDNPGQKAGLAEDPYYEYYWYTFDNKTEELNVVTERAITRESRILLPKDEADFLMCRIRTRSQQQRGWRKNVDVYIRMNGTPSIVGIEREVGAFVLDRDLQGRLVARSNIEFGGSYKGLSDEQRRLVDDWFDRFNRITQRKIEVDEGYDNLPLSTRTTFEGVTNALTETALTEESGRDLGLAVDLVEHIEAVHGRIQGAGGDEQFRIYVALKPNTIQTLEASQQFKRGADNTVFHKGYPINYRQQGKEPTMQISIAENEQRADIDVDYRSSKFPSAVLNGHLTSANSDVRAGNNYSRHVSRWEGFANWWRGLFGLPFITEIVGELDPEETLVPLSPRKGKGKPEEAMEDWLNAWFVDNRPEQAVAYMAPSSFACMEAWSEDNPIDYGIAPLLVLDWMVAAKHAVGKIQDLRQVVEPETVGNPRLRVVQHERSDLFVLYDVPEDLALQFDCARRNSPEADEPMEQSDRYGRDFGTVFRLKTTAGKKGGEVILLWAKEDKYWKIVSYRIDPGVRELGDVPDLRPKVELTLQKMTGDPDLLAAVGRFGTLWGAGEFDKMLDYFAPKSLGCVGLYLEGDLPGGDEAARNRLRQGLEKVYQAFARADDITSLAQPVEFVHPDIRIVDHPKSDRYTIAALPDHMGEAYGCDRTLDETTWKEPANKTYGNYYAAAIQFNLVGEDPAVLYLLWAKEGGAWKIISFAVVSP